jgi:hypothetical protein
MIMSRSYSRALPSETCFDGNGNVEEFIVRGASPGQHEADRLSVD